MLAQSTASAVPPPVADNTPVSGFISSPAPTLIPPKVSEEAVGKEYDSPGSPFSP